MTKNDLASLAEMVAVISGVIALFTHFSLGNEAMTTIFTGVFCICLGALVLGKCLLGERGTFIDGDGDDYPESYNIYLWIAGIAICAAGLVIGRQIAPALLVGMIAGSIIWPPSSKPRSEPRLRHRVAPPCDAVGTNDGLEGYPEIILVPDSRNQRLLRAAMESDKQEYGPPDSAERKLRGF